MFWGVWLLVFFGFWRLLWVFVLVFFWSVGVLFVVGVGKSAVVLNGLSSGFPSVVVLVSLVLCITIVHHQHALTGC
jgi:hypothetical protein